MIIKYIDSYDDKIFTLGNKEKHVIQNAKDIKMIFNSNEIRNNSPFSVKITETLTPANILMITIIIVLVFVGLNPLIKFQKKFFHLHFDCSFLISYFD